MSIVRFSTGYRNHRLNGGSLQQAFQNGKILGYSGTQPSSADNAPTGSTNLIVFTTGSGAHTAETIASGSVTIAGASGSVDGLTVNSVELMALNPFSAATVVDFNGSLAQTAADVCVVINKGTWWHKYTATSSGAVITLKPLPGFGDTVNTHVVACATTTLTDTPANMSGGVDPANGLQFGATAAGAIVKSGTWSGVGLVAGNVNWVRFVGSQTDAGGASTTLIRMDMDAATASAFFQMSSQTVAVGATVTIDAGTFTEQAVVTA